MMKGLALSLLQNNGKRIVIYFLFSTFLFPQAIDNLCGVRCLLVIYKEFGIVPEFKKISRLIEKYPNGMSMYSLYKILNKKGLHAQGVKVSLKELKELNIPAILFMYPHHFVVFRGYKNGKYEIIDPPKKYYLREKQLKKYSGFALLVSRDKIPEIKRDGPDIRFSKYRYNFGRIKPGREVRCKFIFTNKGTAPLIIKKVRAGCGCVDIEVSQTFLVPGEKGKIKVKFDTEGREGIQKQFIYVHSNDPITPLILLSVEGIVHTSFRYYPYLVDFGRIRIGEISKREIFLLSGEGEKLKIKKIVVPDNFKIKKEKLEKKEGYKITLTFKPEKIARMNDKIRIYTTNRRIEIPIKAEVKGEISCFPEFFFFGMVKNDEKLSRSITIYNYFQKDFQITEISKNIDWVSSNCQHLKNNKYRLVATLNKGRLPIGIAKGEIRVKTNIPNEPVLKIPVYVWVEK